MPEKCERCNDKGYLHADGVFCPDCNGWGTGPYHPSDTVKCKTCDGVGRVGRPLRKGEPNPLLAEVDYDQVTVYESCPDCSSIASQCATCGGGGKVWTDSILPHDCPDCDLLTSPMKSDTSDQSGDATDMIDHIPDAGQKMQPPEGYATWLDYAVQNMAGAVMAKHGDRLVSCNEMSDAVLDELAELRARPDVHGLCTADDIAAFAHKLGREAGDAVYYAVHDAISIHLKE